MKEYPFVRCLNPQIIRNQYTNELLTVGCGKCEACLQSKSYMSVLKCRLESKNWLYAKFVTLTFDEEHVPRMEFTRVNRFKVDGEIKDDYSDYVLISKDTGEYLGEYSNILQYDRLRKKVGNHDLPYLDKYLLQKFLKRLRRYYDRYSKKHSVPIGQIRYYACGEYGPVHFRPHFHLILWYSCDEINSSISEAVLACWKLGRVSTETPRDDVSSYVAKYVNSYCRLPKVYQLPKTRPFSVHSQHLGESFFQASKEEIYQSSAKDIVTKSFVVANSYTEFTMWRSLKAWYFPRCAAYSLLSTYERLSAYTVEAAIYEFTRKPKLSDQVRYVLDYISGITDRFNPLAIDEFIWSACPRYSDAISYIIKLCNIVPCQLKVDYGYEKAFRSVYMMLRLSRHFITFCCDSDPNKYLLMVQKIENFYSELDGMYLHDDYKLWVDYSHEWFETEEEYVYLRAMVPSDITFSKVYRKFRQESLQKYENSMKHKRQNDLNKVFENK